MSQQPKTARRTFFTLIGGAAAAGVAAKIASKTQPIVAASAKEPEGDGYRLTEHIKKYYRTTTI